MTWVKCGSGWRKTATVSTFKMALMETPLWSVLAGEGTWESFPSFSEETLMWTSKTGWGHDHGSSFLLAPMEAVDVICLLFVAPNTNSFGGPYFRETDTHWGHITRLKSKIKHRSKTDIFCGFHVWLCPCISKKKKKKMVHSFVWIERLPFFSSSPPHAFLCPSSFPTPLPHYYRSKRKDFLENKYWPGDAISLVRFLPTLSMFWSPEGPIICLWNKRISVRNLPRTNMLTNQRLLESRQKGMKNILTYVLLTDLESSELRKSRTCREHPFRAPWEHPVSAS